MSSATMDKALLYTLYTLLWIGMCLCSIHCQQEMADHKKKPSNAVVPIALPMDTLSFTKGQFIDPRDQQVYSWMQFENDQKWMMQNLDFKTQNSTCYNREKSCSPLGQLYNWKEAMIACPKGWKLPTKKNWEELIQLLGGERKAYSQLMNQADLAMSYGGVYDPLQKKYSYIGKNGNYWTSTSNKQQAWQYNFSKDYEKLFALQESKDLFFSCRCMEGEKKQKAIVKKKTKKNREIVKKDIIAESTVKPQSSIEKSSSTKRINGSIRIGFVNSTSAEKLLLLILKREQASSADLIVGKPNKQKKEETNLVNSFEIQHSGNGYCYVFFIAENKIPQLIYPLVDNLSDQADLIIGKPKPKKTQQVAYNPTHLIVENTNAIPYTNEKLVFCLTSSPINKLERITSLSPTAVIESTISEMLSRTTIPYDSDALAIETNELNYQLNVEDQQIFVFTISIKE